MDTERAFLAEMEHHWRMQHRGHACWLDPRPTHRPLRPRLAAFLRALADRLAPPQGGPLDLVADGPAA